VSPKYSTVAAADVLSDPMSTEEGSPADIEQIRISKIRSGLGTTKHTLSGLRGKASSVQASKLSATLASQNKIAPMISTGERWVILPDSFEEEDYYIGWTMNALAQSLGLTVYTVKYEGEVQANMTDETEKISIGMFLAINDFDHNIRVKKGKNDPVELGRTIVRAQQVLRLFTSKNLGMEALRKDQFYFGNQTGEIETINNIPVPVKYSAKTLGSLFREKLWAEQLRKLLLTLIRESARLLTESVATHAIVTNLLSKEETINLYCSTWTKITVGKGRKKKEEKVREVPKRPKPSPLLTQAENHFVDSIAKNVFREVVPEDSDWPLLISNHGFGPVKDRLRENYSDRRLFRQSYARITTSRLKDFRKLKPDLRYKKKKDVTGVDLDALIESRTSRAATFASEIAFLDQTFKGSLLYYRTEVTKGTKVVLDIPASKLKIAEDIERLGIYSESPQKPTSEEDFVLVDSKKLPEIVLEKTKQGIIKKARKPLEKKVSSPKDDSVNIFMDGGNVIKQITKWSNINQTEEVIQKVITNTPEGRAFVLEHENSEEPELSEAESEEGKEQPEVAAAPSRDVSTQIKLDILDKEIENITKSDRLSSRVKIWFPVSEWTVLKDGSLATENNVKSVDNLIKSLWPVIHNSLIPAEADWYKSRGLSNFVAHVGNDVLAKFNKDQVEAAQAALIESLSKLATEDGVLRALSSLRK
jgi:hypothetical protein